MNQLIIVQAVILRIIMNYLSLAANVKKAIGLMMPLIILLLLILLLLLPVYNVPQAVPSVMPLINVKNVMRTFIYS